jgi:hypothetical protein
MQTKKKYHLRVIGQLTIGNKVSLIAEHKLITTSSPYFFVISKGDVVKRINEKTYNLMTIPKTVIVEPKKNGPEFICLVGVKENDSYKIKSKMY